MSYSRNFISNVFSSVSEKYDLMNNVMSFGIQNLWKKKFIDLISVENTLKFADISCGTGDIALKLLKKHNFDKAILVDPELKMLDLAKSKLLNNGVSLQNVDFTESDAESMDLSSHNLDFITISFGARNFSNLQLGLQNAFNALKSGGYLYIMEFSPKLNNDTLQKLYYKYLDIVLPKMGKYVAKSEESYRYLSESIKNFLEPSDMKRLLSDAGFSFTDSISLSNGIVEIYIARK